MFEIFTEKAIKVIMLAQEEARRLGHNFVGTEQILLGLIGEGTGLGGRVLKEFSVTLADARLEIEKLIGRGSGFVAVEIPFTPRCKRLLENSWAESKALGHNHVNTEHLLLGLIREGDGVGPSVLKKLGVNLAEMRTRILDLSSTSELETAKDEELKRARLARFDIASLHARTNSLESTLSGLQQIVKSPSRSMEEYRRELYDLAIKLRLLDQALAPQTLARCRRLIDEVLNEIQELQAEYLPQDKGESEGDEE